MGIIFDNLSGHTSQKETFLEKIQEKRLPSSLLFIGPQGVGKKIFAWGLAQALLCERGGHLGACGICSSCLRVEKHESEGVFFVSPENASIKIEKSREIIEFLSLKAWGKSRIVIIDEAQALNPQAANALLKNLEEPPEDSHFILIASSAYSVLTTLRSRCQQVHFTPLLPEEIQKTLDCEEWVAQSSRGSMEFAHFFMQEDVMTLRQRAFSCWETYFSGQWKETLEKLMDLSKEKEESLMVIRFWQQLVRDALVEKIMGEWGKQGYKEPQGNMTPKLSQEKREKRNGEVIHFPKIHQDYVVLQKQCATRFPDQLEDLFEELKQMERQVLSHLDRSLCFENFFYQLRAIEG